MRNRKSEVKSQNGWRADDLVKPAKRFQDLIVWKKAHRFVLDVYKRTKQFPKEEMYGLTSQMRRAAVSIAANIAEGFRKRSKADKHRFLEISLASLEESRYYIILAHDLNYVTDNTLMQYLEEVSRLLMAYKNKVRSS